MSGTFNNTYKCVKLKEVFDVCPFCGKQPDLEKGLVGFSRDALEHARLKKLKKKNKKGSGD